MSTTAFDRLISDAYAARHYLVELAPYDLTLGAVRQLYYSDHGFTTRGTDNPPHQHFEARVAEALNFQRNLYREGAIGGASLPSFGEIRLDNADGGLDFFRNLAFDGRQVVVRLGGKGFAYADFGVIFRGTAHSAVVDEQQVTVRLRDLQYKLDVPFLTELYDPPGTGEDALDCAFHIVGNGGNDYHYASLGGVTSYVVQPGDVLQYDIYWPRRSSRPARIAFDLEGTLNGAAVLLRASGAVDQNGLSVHPTTDLTARALGTWYHREIALPASLHGAAINYYDVGCEHDAGAGNVAKPRALLRDVKITGTGGVLRKTIWAGSVTAPAQTAHQTTNAGNYLSVRLRSELEAGASLEGRPKPLCFGKCLNVTPVQVNPAQLLYQVHDGPIQAVEKVYDNGIALTVTTHYTVDPLRGTFKLNQAPVGAITADVLGDTLGAYGYLESVSAVAHRVVTTFGPLTDADLDYPTFTALHNANTAVVGLYVTEPATILQVLDELVNSIGAFYGFNRNGLFEVGLFTAPSASAPVGASFGPAEILEIEPLPTELPAWRQRVGYEKNWTVQSGDSLAGGVTADRKAFLAEEMRVAVAADPAVKQAFLLAADPEPLPTLLHAKSAAEAEAARLLAFYGVRREMYRVTVKTQPYKLDLGDQVALDYTRFGLAGRLFRIVGLEERADVNRVTMELWG